MPLLEVRNTLLFRRAKHFTDCRPTTVALGIGFFSLAKRKCGPPPQRGWTSHEQSRLLENGWAQKVLGGLYVAFCLVILILPLIGPYKNANGTVREVKGWWYISIIGGAFFFAIGYYFLVLFSPLKTITRVAGVELSKKRHGAGDRGSLLRQCDLCRETAVVHRHSQYGYRDYVELRFPRQPGVRQKDFFYWLFGGPNEAHYPS